jgi:molecular chaperone GrpE (heat shock protein)
MNRLINQRILTQDVRQAANQVKQELAEARLQLTNKQKDCSRLEVEVQDLKKESEEECRKYAKYNQEVRFRSFITYR